jgi:hypothetical protein
MDIEEYEAFKAILQEMKEAISAMAEEEKDPDELAKLFKMFWLLDTVSDVLEKIRIENRKELMDRLRI